MPSISPFGPSATASTSAGTGSEVKITSEAAASGGANPPTPRLSPETARPRPGEVIDDELVAGLLQIGRHALAHHAEPDKTDLHDGPLSSPASRCPSGHVEDAEDPDGLLAPHLVVPGFIDLLVSHRRCSRQVPCSRITLGLPHERPCTLSSARGRACPRWVVERLDSSSRHHSPPPPLPYQADEIIQQVHRAEDTIALMREVELPQRSLVEPHEISTGAESVSTFRCSLGVAWTPPAPRA